MSRSTTLAAMLLTFLFCHSNLSFAEVTAAPRAETFFGEARPVGNGVAWSWVERDEKGIPMRMGITLTETALTGLPETLPSTGLPGWEYVLELPKGASINPYDHIGFNWNPKGHIPPGIYDVPHFDVHFYLITRKEREGITARDEDLIKCRKKPAAKFIPAAYILPDGTEEAHMGTHWVDTTSPEFNKQAFTKTFIYGSYNGHLAFIEPMLTMAFLETKPDVSDAIKLPEAYEASGYYPTSYSVKYDPVRKEYTISLEGLTYQK